MHFRKFSDQELEEYLNTNEWKDRSGAMTIEGRGGKWVTKQEGEYWNVVGLPVNKLKRYLPQLKS
ncbi:Maf family protein [Candidatus Peregrinibacteria bacterium]|nr:MAG: Maf family protein [Candidatus Peregrinibacteria bacterium]